MLKHFEAFDSLDHVIKRRKGEVKLGDRVRFVGKISLESLKAQVKSGARFALIGIPESLGIQANHGTSGAEDSWEQFLLTFANLQSNRYFDGNAVLCLGQVDTKDLQERASELSPEDRQFYTKLRSLCQELDHRVAPVIELVSKAGYVPIIIGGGHNNSYPILKGLTKGLGSLQGINCINFDAHADFRPLEGRHSGNGFSYAFYQGYLQRYYILGLNQSANSEAMLKNIDLEAGVDYQPYHPGLDPDITTAIEFVNQAKAPVGLEIDLDVISYMPASAFSVSGYNLDQIRVLMGKVMKNLKPAYFHLTEGQVTNEPREAQIVGRTLSTLVLDFVKNYSG